MTLMIQMVLLSDSLYLYLSILCILAF